ncbi:hypothetical protein [Algisphaera agarilytica]|uniref:Uncharacterized protein n=1 Tax=Algisphaera agarilytica TaxID=1385975 RepID=A0A7X0H6R8_9BACT|nr:hypothetical protein [Algisphaera agarilytica]MBB6430302.1 hypothetical protein [Algisphaera agarilytica]
MPSVDEEPSDLGKLAKIFKKSKQGGIYATALALAAWAGQEMPSVNSITGRNSGSYSSSVEIDLGAAIFVRFDKPASDDEKAVKQQKSFETWLVDQYGGFSRYEVRTSTYPISTERDCLLYTIAIESRLLNDFGSPKTRSVVRTIDLNLKKHFTRLESPLVVGH